MSAEATAAVAEFLPRRTWREWWLAWPRWFRIGVWAFVGLLVLHVAIGVRIAVGLIETKEVIEFRQAHQRRNPGILPKVVYFDGWWPRREWFRGQRLMLAGLYGRSNSRVVAIAKDSATEADLKYIAQHFPNLECLEFIHAELTPAGLAALCQCRKLKELFIQCSDLDEGTACQIARLENLEEIAISNGLVPPDIRSQLQKLPRLRKSSIMYFGRSGEAAAGNKFAFRELHLTISWADGERSANVRRPYSLTVEVPDPKNGVRIRPIGAAERLEAFRLFPQHHLKDGGDGDYRFHLRMGNFEAEPLTVKIVNGQANTVCLEFRMPCTKAEALKK